MITLRHDICNNPVFRHTALFTSDRPNTQACHDELRELYKHLVQLRDVEYKTEYLNFQPNINHLSACFEDLDELMMVKLKFCGA